MGEFKLGSFSYPHINTLKYITKYTQCMLQKFMPNSSNLSHNIVHLSWGVGWARGGGVQRHF